MKIGQTIAHSRSFHNILSVAQSVGGFKDVVVLWRKFLLMPDEFEKYECEQIKLIPLDAQEF